ncbi:MAG TPA: ABC transporter substrate-binding protein [Segeticoccus sp.]|uniref:ABC transporter substrate-binding protein n=1 Tax=Segeticoccus sp. TaxID=2706531 RepID=UPI002D81060A|nr:ABC transporter substrate-binding protein [Segeticoccus sp.]HET8599354.1 ABC transporter substrate-binding protein [Segeticoccus sp.]
MRQAMRFKTIAVVTGVMLLGAACGSSDNGGASAEGSSGGAGGGNAKAEPLKLGYVLPETGDLAYLGPPQIQAMKYAVSEINKSGGVLGSPIPAVVGGDEAGDQAIASQSADRVLNEGVDAVIGAAASGMSLAIIDKITGAGVVQCSGSNTAPTFTDYKDGGYYFRTAPSDALQGPVLADVITGDGHSKVAIVARADDYGKGLADATAKSLESSGASVVLNESYDPKATNFNATVAKVVAQKPDAVVVVAFEEGKQIIKGLMEKGLTPDKVGIYGADGLRSEDLPKLVNAKNPQALDGMKGTAPASADNPAFTKNLKAFAPDLEELQFAPQVYDCVNVIALAAEAAKSTDAASFKEQMVAVTKDGEKCNSFADCKKLLDAGKDIDYDGASGPLDFVDAGEPGKATIEVYSYKDGKLKTLDTREAAPVE